MQPSPIGKTERSLLPSVRVPALVLVVIWHSPVSAGQIAETIEVYRQSAGAAPAFPLVSANFRRTGRSSQAIESTSLLHFRHFRWPIPLLVFEMHPEATLRIENSLRSPA